MQRAKYRKFVESHPWFPAALRPMIDWQSSGPGENDPDQATEAYFRRGVSHLGIIPYTPNILRRKGVRHHKTLVRSPLLPKPLSADQIRVHQVVYHDRDEKPFARNHAMFGETVNDAVIAYCRGRTCRQVGRKIDAIIELTLVGFDRMTTIRINVMLFPT